MMKLFLAALLFMTLDSTAWARPEIRFEREIEVSERSEYRLSDLVELKGGDEALLRRLEQTIWNGDRSWRESMRTWRTDQGEQPLFVLPSEIRLKKVKTYSSAEFRRKLRNALSVQCQDCEFSFQSIQDGNVRLQSDWQMDESAIKVAGSLLIPVRDSSSTQWVSVRLRVQRPALVTKRSVLMGQSLTNSDYESRLMDVTFARETPVSAKDLGEMVTARMLGAGQVIYPSDVKREDLVRRGQIVKLIAGASDFEVSVPAIAEQSGRMGDVVRLKTQDSGKVVSGQVSGPGEVRMQ